jgi:hypothetical protein
MASLAEEVKAMRVLGLSSLNNLFTIPTAIYAMATFHTGLDRAFSKNAKLRLIIIGCIVIIHALLFSARMFMVYYVAIIMASYILSKPADYSINQRTILKIFGSLLGIIWIGELLRGGLWYSTSSGSDLFSINTQRHILDRLIQGYFAADFNNAMILLDHPSSYQFFSTTQFAGFMSNIESYTTIPSWTSSFGTINILGLWWYDWGLFTYVLCFTAGMVMGAVYRVVERTAGSISLLTILFVIAYPGIWSMIRTNYFSESIFIIPFMFLLLALVIVDAFGHKPSLSRSEVDYPICISSARRNGHSYSVNGSDS